jgi:hypothetical protein
MVDDRPYPHHKLTPEETSERKDHIHKEHTELTDKWYRSGLQPVFDVGRLASPIWQSYRRDYKERAKANKNVPWESKWKRPEAFKQSKFDFLHMTAKDYTIEHYIDNDEDVKPTTLRGLSGSFADVTFSLFKHEMAKVKHGSKFNLTPEQKNMVLLPGEFASAAQEGKPYMMTGYWMKYGRNKKPWEFNRVFISGSVIQKGIPGIKATQGWHAVLYVMNFGEKPYHFDWYDSAHGNWTDLGKTVRDWLVKDQGMSEEDGERMGFKGHKEVPLQCDPWNCGQNMLLTGRALIRCEKPKYDGYIAPWTEALEALRMAFKGYEHGRTNIFGRKAHPGIDAVVEKFSAQKVKDHERIKKWKTKQMKGFK